jgi:hypothetical protein
MKKEEYMCTFPVKMKRRRIEGNVPGVKVVDEV